MPQKNEEKIILKVCIEYLLTYIIFAKSLVDYPLLFENKLNHFVFNCVSSVILFKITLHSPTKKETSKVLEKAATRP